jgi:ketosteroid isomerase-like protein
MSQENVETVRQLNEAYGTGDGTWVDFYAPDVEAHMWSERPHDATVYRGVDGIKEIAALFTDQFDDLCWDREMVMDAGGDRVIALFRQRGRRKDDGKWVETQVAGVFSLHDGKVVLVENYPSWNAALESQRLAH